MLRLTRTHAVGGLADDGRASLTAHWASATPGRKVILSCFMLLCLFNVALPKGGIKLDELPLTWGYVLLFLVAIPAGIGLFFRPKLLILPLSQFSLFCVPIALLIVFKWIAYGLPLSVVAVYLTQFLVLPLIVLVVLSPYLEDVPSDALGTFLVWCIRFTVVWGLMNFLLYPVLNDIIQIPYLTINAADYGDILAKNNRRGSLMKLMSTYNNGNVYGDCMILLAPVYLLYERSRIWIALFVAALICTLSRTVWFSMAAVAGIMLLTGQINARRAGLWLGVIIAMALIIAMLPLIGWSPDDLFRTDLGGRTRIFAGFELSMLGGVKMQVPEIVYFGFLNSFGVLGFPLAVGCLVVGPIYGLLNFQRLSPLRRAAFAGTCAYMAGSLLDGAFVFPPTMALFFFVTGLIYRRGLRPTARKSVLPVGWRRHTLPVPGRDVLVQGEG